MKDIFLKLMFNTQENYKNFIMKLPFLTKRKKIEKVESLLLIYMIKTITQFT